MGAQWLSVLVLAAVFVFGIKGGVGAERLSEFFQRARLSAYVGSSPTTVRRLRRELEASIAAYQAEQEARLREADCSVAICAGADETFFDRVVLVMMDVASGYIVLEEAADDRTYATWHEKARQALARAGIQVESLISDRAQALVKLAQDGLGCPSTPDLFHALRDLAKVWGVCLPLKVARVEEKLQQARQQQQAREAKGQSALVQQRLIRHLTAEVATLQDDHHAYRAVLEQATQAVHPFALTDDRPQHAAQIEEALHQAVHRLNDLRAPYTARDNQAQVLKFTRQIPGLAAAVDAWWERVEGSLLSEAVDTQTQRDLIEQLLPVYYWHEQREKTKTPSLKAAYQQAYQRARQTLHTASLSTRFTPAEWQHWQAWAGYWSRQYQRASSAIEGRNGALSQRHHSARGIPASRLSVLTVIHNFDTRRPDGTTPAQRLFGQPFPDLFDWLMARSGPLPMPRRARPRPSPNLLNLHPVPP